MDLRDSVTASLGLIGLSPLSRPDDTGTAEDEFQFKGMGLSVGRLQRGTWLQHLGVCMV